MWTKKRLPDFLESTIVGRELDWTGSALLMLSWTEFALLERLGLGLGLGPLHDVREQRSVCVGVRLGVRLKGPNQHVSQAFYAFHVFHLDQLHQKTE